MNTQGELASRIRFDIKNIARVWNYWLGGNEHYPVDRAAGDEFALLCPEIRDIARQDRRFLVRCVSQLAEAGVRQFLDIGSGLPTMQNTHEVAQAIAPESKIVYVDNDPVVLSHARAWLTSMSREGATAHLDADVRRPDMIIAGARKALDFSQPIAVLLLGVLGHAVKTAEQLHQIVRQLVDALPSGSYLVCGDGIELGNETFRKACQRFGYTLRSPEDFRACFDGLELSEPGIVAVNRWQPQPGDLLAEPARSWVGVGRKP